MPTKTIPEISAQLSGAYNKVQRELAIDPDMTVEVWDEALTRLQGIDFQQHTLQDFVEASAYVSILNQVLTAYAARQGGFNVK